MYYTFLNQFLFSTARITNCDELHFARDKNSWWGELITLNVITHLHVISPLPEHRWPSIYFLPVGEKKL